MSLKDQNQNSNLSPNPNENFLSASDKSRIEELKKRLYSQNEGMVPVARRPKFHEHATVVNERWVTRENEIPKFDVQDSIAKRRSFFKKALLFSFAFFVLAISFAAYSILNGTNSISSDNIDVKFIGPVSIGSGEDLILDVSVTNNNTSDIVLADLVVNYPEGTRQEKDNTIPLVNERISLGTIKSGELVKKRLQMVFFGEEGSKKNIKTAIEYRIPGSTNIFRKQKDVPISIGNSPVTLVVNTTKEITTGQDVSLVLNIKSNSTSIIHGVLIKAQYPFGFKFKSATPLPATGTDTWSLGDIAPNSEQNIKIVGSIQSQENEERVFKFKLGTVDSSNETEIGTTFVMVEQAIGIKKPFIGSDIVIDGRSTEFVPIKAGEVTRGEIVWQNNLDVSIKDVVIEVKFSGEFLDRTTVGGDMGFFRSSDNTLVWDKSTMEELEEVGPGRGGRISFGFSTVAPTIANAGSVRRPSVTLDLAVKGTRLNENDVPEQLTSSVTRTAQVRSMTNLETRLVRTVGPFENFGPFPPQPEQDTTYTALLTVGNSYNTVKNGVYTAKLPTYVKWLGKVNPTTAQVSFDPLTRIITWNVGDIAPGTGYSTASKQLAFQVSFQPSISQVNSTPVIIKEQKLSGKDSFTDQSVESFPDNFHQDAPAM